MERAGRRARWKRDWPEMAHRVRVMAAPAAAAAKAPPAEAEPAGSLQASDRRAGRTGRILPKLRAAVAFGCCAPACYSARTEGVVTVRDPTLVTVRPNRPHSGNEHLPAGRGPAAMPAVVGTYATLWLV